MFNIVSVITGTALAFVFEPQENWLHPHFGERAVFGWCFGVLLGGLYGFSGGFSCRRFGSSAFATSGSSISRTSGLRTVLILMVPSAIAGSAVQVNVLVNGQFASYISGHGPVSWLYYAFRLVQLPIGIFGVAIATVTLPAVARQHALDDLEGFLRQDGRGGAALRLLPDAARVGRPGRDRATGDPTHLRARNFHREQHAEQTSARASGLHHRSCRLFGHQDSRALFLR